MPCPSLTTSDEEIAHNPIGPKGCGGIGPASSLPFLEDGGASTSSRRLESEPMALATGGIGGFRPGLLEAR